MESIDGVDVAQEESEGRLVQHIQSNIYLLHTVISCTQYFFSLDLDDVTDEEVKRLCTGSHVFFNCLGTTRATAGSAVRHCIPTLFS